MSIWDGLLVEERLRRILEGAAADPGDSYLFVGPRGSGKREAARAFAATVICPDACGECSCCSRALRGIHPDLTWVEPEGLTYPVASLREMVAEASQTPAEAARRVFVVDEADLMAEQSQNSLLKALEEPNRSLTWVLLAEALDAFLPTVLSRCAIIEFSPVPEEAVLDLLSSRYHLTGEEAGLVVTAARGDIETAAALAGDPNFRAIRDLALEAATQPFTSPAPPLALVARLTELVGKARSAREHELAAELAAFDESADAGRGVAGARTRLEERHKRILRRVETEAYGGFLGWLACAFRDLAAMGAGAGPEAITSPGHARSLGESTRRASPGFWLDMVDAALAAKPALAHNVNPSLLVEALLLRLVA